jgi:hypothetical protein
MQLVINSVVYYSYRTILTNDQIHVYNSIFVTSLTGDNFPVTYDSFFLKKNNFYSIKRWPPVVIWFD